MCYWINVKEKTAHNEIVEKATLKKIFNELIQGF